MIYTAIDNFYLTDEQLQDSPSRKDGIDEATETTLRIYGCDLIQESGILLKMPQAVMATGQVLFHRFYCKKSFARFNVKKVAASCVWLASKLEESPRKASLRSTLCVRFKSEVVACGVVYAAARRFKLPLPENPPWWKAFDAEKSGIDEVCRVLAHLYSLPKAQYISVCRDGDFSFSSRPSDSQMPKEVSQASPPTSSDASVLKGTLTVVAIEKETTIKVSVEKLKNKKSDDESRPSEGEGRAELIPTSKSGHRAEGGGERIKDRDRDRERDRDRVRSERDRGRDSDRERDRDESEREKDKAKDRGRHSKDRKDSGHSEKPRHYSSRDRDYHGSSYSSREKDRHRHH